MFTRSSRMRNLKPLMIAGGMMFMCTACVNPAPLLSPADVRTATVPLKTVSLQESSKNGSAVFSVRIPNDKSWQRIRAAWGDPGYLLSVVAPGRRTLLCFDKYNLDVRVSGDSGIIHSEPANSPLYGYSLDCVSVGVKFNASPGDLVELRVVFPGSLSKIPGNLMLCAYWGPEVKDRLVGLSIDQELRRHF
jgi:hypothetical protein